ncbi:lytic transglycosylase domain-containing protein [Rhodoferax sp.]|uniref:lytic transglycosylase domain-containing protein n=1 Tax=Rhodoferax sp. TaxID=50421 RepID=UPI002607ECFE|nr:lytic transglycosylase domain-containing protein [Rhodoferax sp.]MDD2808554.1 lytic transglycosylase domain-containing protein [Rhodoferax sp.]MDD4944414.1 lytic transglycosylase domain-containing protein [Rhodoferax sp.]
MSASTNMTLSPRRFAAALTKGFMEITHNSFALIGLVVLFAAVTLIARPELRQLGEIQLFSWLQARQFEVTGLVSDLLASDRATATDPKELPKQQAAMAVWLSKKYSVAPEPVSAIVAEAYDIGQRVKLEPTLILAVVAIESGFNPFAQSHVGAQGLMQVMTQIHSDKYQSFGGKFAAFDPLANLSVGIKVLKDCIRSAGSVEGGLKYYVGAANLDDDGGYAAKVLAEQAKLQWVGQGKQIPTWETINTASNTTVKIQPLSTQPEKDAAPTSNLPVQGAKTNNEDVLALQ